MTLQTPRVVAVKALSGLRLEVFFSDGLRGLVDCTRLVNGERAGVFAALRDEALFGTAHVEHGAVSWPGGIDLAPDSMHASLRANGLWVLE